MPSLRRGMRPEERQCLPKSQNTNNLGVRRVVKNFRADDVISQKLVSATPRMYDWLAGE